MKHVPIPEHWTPRDALCTVAFLENVIAAIWRAHGAPMAFYLQFEHPEQQRTRRRTPRHTPHPHRVHLAKPDFEEQDALDGIDF